ncbi:hypothetical protein RchiOBHm_Chr1g0354501 [Rosa chinensis]|uniref:Uncharacterized protein n=1 Tax=Rosa chinensis TaxID=74649 RepID=A0A2P6SH39_ROSCH|nr:hypothetical protein RchiOBHm_Chr1g0354501 [Rosa chinensis]
MCWWCATAREKNNMGESEMELWWCALRGRGSRILGVRLVLREKVRHEGEEIKNGESPFWCAA